MTAAIRPHRRLTLGMVSDLTVGLGLPPDRFSDVRRLLEAALGEETAPSEHAVVVDPGPDGWPPVVRHDAVSVVCDDFITHHDESADDMRELVAAKIATLLSRGGGGLS